MISARFVAWLLLLAGAYVAAAKLGIELSVARGVVTPVWAPTGIAIAALFLGGRRLWPAVAVGAFVANATSGADVPVSAVIAAGNTLEAIVGSELLRRARVNRALNRVRDVMAVIFLAAAISPLVAATNGVTALWAAGDVSGSDYDAHWLLWWVGDAMGALILVPLLLVWSTRPFRRIDGRRLTEAIVVLALLVALSCLVFLAGWWRYPHLLFPALIWATLRFGQSGAVTGSFVVTALAVAGAVEGSTPLTDRTATEIVQIMEGLLAAVAIALMILGAVLAERTRAEGRLAATLDSLNEAQTVARLGSWSWDIAADRVNWSDELYRMYDLDPGSVDVTYDSYLERVHPADRDAVRGFVERAYADGRPFTFEHRIVTPDGSVRWHQSRGRVVAGADGAPVRMVGTAQDVTERKRLDDLRDSILSTVSHELRTPLTAILGFSLTLAERGDQVTEEMRVEIAEHLAAQARKLDRLLSDLLDLDRLRLGTVSPSFHPTNVGDLVEGVVAAFDSTRAIRVDADSVVVDVDAPKVERIVDNLLANAVRHTPPETEIEVTVRRRDGGVMIGVDDRGEGVPPDDRETIFELFNRGRADSTARPGAGIGLSLVAQFTELHGGRAWVEENPGGGASFRVFLPLERPD